MAAAAAADPSLLDVDTREGLAGRIEAAPGQPHAAALECSICKSPSLDSPVRTNPCGHLYHERCLCHWLQDKTGRRRFCPECRSELYTGYLAYSPVDKHLKAVIDCIEVACPQDCEQPRKRLRYDSFARHISECPKTPVRCANDGCGAVLPRADMSNVHAPQCPYGVAPCEQCRDPVQRINMREHMAQQCPRRRSKCTGCGQSMEHCDKGAHELQCTGPASLGELAALRKEFKEFQQQARDVTAQLQQQVGDQASTIAWLRHRVDEQEQELQQQAGQPARAARARGRGRRNAGGERQDAGATAGGMRARKLRVLSPDWPGLNGQYLLHAASLDDYSVWAKDAYRIYRSRNGAWKLCVGEIQMAADTGVLVTSEKGSRAPTGLEWGRFEAGVWQPADFTVSVERD